MKSEATSAALPDESKPSEYELSMAMLWNTINTCRLFHKTPPNDILPNEQKFLDEWRKIPAKRRQAALDFVEPLPDPKDLEDKRVIEAMRRRVL